MLLKQIIEVYDILDRADANGQMMKDYLENNGAKHVTVNTFTGEKGSTDFITITIPGKNGKIGGGSAPTLGIVGRLGGLGARPEKIGFVSDGDGALSALAVAAKLTDMQNKGDTLYGDVIISTHICPDAPTQARKPVAFMGSPIDMVIANKEEVSPEMDAILSIDTTKGNRVINVNGFAISPTVMQGYILKTADDLLDIMQDVTGTFPKVFPLSIQDITPYGNNLYHLNSILQPATATDAPVVGVAITAESAVPGSASGVTSFASVDSACRFALEVAKSYGRGQCAFFDQSEWDILQKRYGSLKSLQTFGNE
jgi:hypothetical protein